MSDVAIRVEGLSKRYRLGAQRQSYGSLRDSLVGLGKRFLPSGKDARAARKPEFWALKDVGFEVKQGEVLGIIGRNGAGKSTLLKLLSEITEPTEGRITMNGRVASLLEVGTGFHPELTGRENIFLNGAILGMARAEIARKFDEIVAFAEVERFIDTQVKHYSSGMYLRLAFAVAAHLEPEILVVDEVLAVGDIEFQKRCIGRMSKVAGEGRTVLFVSHNLGAVRQLCSRGLLLHKGHQQLSGSVDEVVNTYLAESHRYSEQLSFPAPDPRAPGVPIRIYCTSTSAKLRSDFNIGENWLIHLEFELFRSLSHVIAAVGIDAQDGTHVITYWSSEIDLEKGRYQVVFNCKEMLASGYFQLVVGLSQRAISFYQATVTGSISVNHIAEGLQPFRTSGNGVLASIDRPHITMLGSVGVE